MRPALFRLLILACLAAGALPAQTLARSRAPNPVVMAVIIGIIGLLPFLAIMMTSFVKLSIVLALIKSGLGTQVPPGSVTSGLAIVLSIFIMAPVAERMYEVSNIRETSNAVFSTDNITAIYNAADKGKEPLRAFLLKHAHPPDRALFLNLARRLEAVTPPNEAAPAQPPAPAPPAAPAQPPAAPPAAAPPGPAQAGLRPDEEFRIVLPAFVTSELKSAFQIGFLILLPFLVIDVVVANVLVASGLTMIQPAVVSLPLKILLFVVADGWYLIVRGLVLSYA